MLLGQLLEGRGYGRLPGPIGSGSQEGVVQGGRGDLGLQRGYKQEGETEMADGHG